MGVAGYEAEEHGLLDMSTPAGWATILAIIGFFALVFTLGRGVGFVAGAGRALGFMFLVAAAELPIHYLSRAYALSHSESPFAAGVGINL